MDEKDKKYPPYQAADIPSLQERHHEKIDRADGYPSDIQQKRLVLFDHDPQRIAAHYPELQKKSEELHQQDLQVRRTAGTVGWLAFAATAAATGYAASKKKISENKILQGAVVVVSSIFAGLGANYVTDRLLGSRVREESADVALASRRAYDRELAIYMDDTQRKIDERLKEQPAAANAQPTVGNDTAANNSRWADEKVKSVSKQANTTARWADDKVKSVTAQNVAQTPASSHVAAAANRDADASKSASV